MSKSFDSIMSMLAPSNNQLFDRFINVKLSQNDKFLPGSTLSITTPVFGQKPKITLSASMSQNETVHHVTLTIYNIDANIDFNDFQYVDIEYGYMNSGFAAHFIGTIINIYMAKPNPNGELVITCASGNMQNTTAVKNYTVSFLKDTVNFKAFITQISIQTGIIYNINEVPPEWFSVDFTVNKATYQFNSLISVITWLNSLFLSISESEGKGIGTGAIRTGLRKIGVGNVSALHPIFAHVTSEGVSISGTYTNGGLKPALKALSNIGSAYISGDSAGTVTAPVNPEIEPGDFIYVNPRYFKTRVINKVGFNKGKLFSIWCVITLQFTFSTYDANNMVLTLVNVKNNIFTEV